MATVAQVAPIMPYLLLVLMLIFRPKGLLGTARHERRAAARASRRFNGGRWVVWGALALVLVVLPLRLHQRLRRSR